MLKVYKTRYYCQVDDGEWVKVGGTGKIMEDRTDLSDEDIIFDSWSWSQIMDFLHVKNLDGFYPDKTIFRKRPYFSCYDRDDGYSWCHDFYDGDFNTFTYKRVYIEDEDVSLQYIMDRFPAEKCIRYLKERGITTCPINNTK